MRTIFYSENNDEKRKKFETSFSVLEIVAEQIAEHLYNKRHPDMCGDDAWPITIAIYAKAEGPNCLGIFEISMRNSPSFSAKKTRTTP